MGGRIDCYFDVVSFYSYIGFVDLLRNLDRLESHGVQVDFHPIFLGGIMQMSGNKPPWLNQAKSRYLSREFGRAAARVGLDGLASPPDLMARSRTAAALRALYFIKANFPRATYLSAIRYLFDKSWRPPHANLTQESEVAGLLAEATETPEGGKKLFTEEDVKRIMEGREAYKETLTAQTAKVVKEYGAFGAPWLYVTNEKGESESFFGSDRFNFVYQHLGVPFHDVTLLPPSKL